MMRQRQPTAQVRGLTTAEMMVVLAVLAVILPVAATVCPPAGSRMMEATCTP